MFMRHVNSRVIILMLSLALLMVFVPSYARKTAKIKVDKTTIDVGVMDNISNVRTISIGFVNKGKEKLKISEIRTSCGCLTVTYPQYLIAPGEKGMIKAVLDLRNLSPMHIDKKIAIYSNSKKSPLVITVTGEYKYAE